MDDMTAAEPSGSVYDDFRFVTRAELTRLELDHLLGTALVRAYMHGFFIDNRLYHKARARIAPDTYEEYRAKKIAEKMEAERQSRISMVRIRGHCRIWVTSARQQICRWRMSVNVL